VHPLFQEQNILKRQNLIAVSDSIGPVLHSKAHGEQCYPFTTRYEDDDNKEIKPWLLCVYISAAFHLSIRSRVEYETQTPSPTPPQDCTQTETVGFCLSGRSWARQKELHIWVFLGAKISARQ